MPSGAVEVGHPTGNELLDSLPLPVFAGLEHSLNRLEIRRGTVLISPFAAISTVYFPTGGMVSLVRGMANGDMVEIGVVGREGMVGWPALIAADMGSIVAIVQLSLTGFSVSTHALLRFVSANPDFGEVLARSMQALFLQVAQTAACNQHHTVAHRLAKWLLMADDRSSSSPMNLTHEFLAMMLGVRRAGVTDAISALKSAGIVESANGRVAILDRHKLERAVCECYGAIQAETERLRPRSRV
ncbi:MAG: Crp/Fnr family transcriptional regulator [Caulobacteraceae bacterium]